MSREEILKLLEEMEEELVQCFHVILYDYKRTGDNFGSCINAHKFFLGRIKNRLYKKY
jgi:hypothetical protein